MPVTPRCRIRRCDRCGAPLLPGDRHLAGDDSQFCDLNELLRRIREQAREILARRAGDLTHTSQLF